MTVARVPSGQVLPPRAAYRLWAPCYDEENAVSFLEDSAVRGVTPGLRGRALLDAGCGTGRRLRNLGEPAERLGVDLVFDMLARNGGRGERTCAGPLFVAADIGALPLATSRFDVIWCRLVLGHVLDLDTAYAELGRVARAGATLIVTDFHAAAVEAGHARTFRDAAGDTHTIEHHVHPAAVHRHAAECAGWRTTLQRDLAVGPGIRPFYERAGALHRYRADLGLPLVLLLGFER